ncbi:hypothetical protein DO021_16110 [Desulfobacter hydrogenophilus]|uniref:Uncharacterized protein n=1 Tax=Desulfobacter hydrogenophilus TaxID=2291 RepID=A0A328FBF0_9BACT|nr:hypothetical protein [Desulfobacter hydrogenophilus]NDY73778.1 hypothetical protein [Desulfobacter hydrogenophilus]QBH14638.1 hypothetical protein EYB58_17930 [Desulfobacter hydrogenophilus]RAM01000.1 hypothetical protein DO021_16110 [Desulfobacter hydrogenophilus]
MTKWIHKSGNRNFTDTKAWAKTIEYNKELKKLINSVVTECNGCEACFDSVIGYIMHIESVTSELFDAIDRIKECKKRL